MHAEAERLIEASFGDVLLRTIGRCYTHQAELYLGNFLQAGLAHIKEKGCAPYTSTFSNTVNELLLPGIGIGCE